MSLSQSQIEALFKRAEETDALLSQLQRQFDSVQSQVRSGKTSASSSSSNSADVPAAAADSGMKSTPAVSIPSGRYVVFVSTQTEPIPFGVLTAYLMVKDSPVLANANASVRLVDKRANLIPSLRAPNGVTINGHLNVMRLLLRLGGKEPDHPIEMTSIDEWTQKVSDRSIFDNKQTLPAFLTKLNEFLQFRSFMFGYSLTSIDLALWSGLKSSKWWEKHSKIFEKTRSGLLNVYRYFMSIDKSRAALACQGLIQEQNAKNGPAPVKKSMDRSKVPHKPDKKGNGGGKKQKKDDGIHIRETASWEMGIDPSKWMGKVVTRFPPEPSGCLHIGHAKAVFLGSEIARRFKGKFLVRLDDTNPAKEKMEFEENILRDLRSLGVVPDRFSHTSDYFPLYLKICTRMIKEGKAFVDKTPRDELQRQRKAREESAYRNQSIDENLRLWDEMKEGSEEGQACCVRMKMDMSSNNGTLRDPVIYRVNIQDGHHRTGFKFKVYPTYDFACPIVDSFEGVTHACRSKEYNERNEQYERMWKLTCTDKDGNPLKKPDGSNYVCPILYQFSRQEFVRTGLSKRFMSKLIADAQVSAWDDPRLPTIQGIFRRGLQLSALKSFVFDQAMTQRNNRQEWDKLWTYNKKVLDPVVGRYFCVNDLDRVKLTLKNVKPNTLKSVPLHPKNSEMGLKVLHLDSSVFIEQFDSQNILKIWQKVTGNGKKTENVSLRVALMNAGIVKITEIDFKEDRVISMIGEYMPKDTNYKKIPVLSWVTANDDAIPIKLVELDYLFDSDDEPTTTPTWFETKAWAEPGISTLSRGTVIQFLKRGFYILDKPYLGRRDDPAVMIFVPDGKAKAMSSISEKLNKVEISNR